MVLIDVLVAGVVVAVGVGVSVVAVAVSSGSGVRVGTRVDSRADAVVVPGRVLYITQETMIDYYNLQTGDTVQNEMGLT